MQRNVLPQHEIACFFVSMPNGSTTIQSYAKLSVHINQASVSYRASVGFLGGNASSLDSFFIRFSNAQCFVSTDVAPGFNSLR